MNQQQVFNIHRSTGINVSKPKQRAGKLIATIKGREIVLFDNLLFPALSFKKSELIRNGSYLKSQLKITY